MCFFAYIAKKITQATKKQEKFECEWIFESLENGFYQRRRYSLSLFDN